MNIITGYRGEPHITSAQSRDENQGSFGVNSYILNVGQKLQAEIVSANEVRIRDGALSHQGCVASIDSGAYDSLEIANGTQGMQRRDLIVARYTKDAETNVEDISLVVIQGTAVASNPSDPAYNTGNIQNGDSPVDMPLYRVNISGVTISSVTQIAAAVRTQKEMDTLIGSTSISGIGNGTLTGAVSTLNSNVTPIDITNTLSPITGATINGGKAYKMGRMVIVNLDIKTTTNITAGFNNLISGLPPATANNTSLSCGIYNSTINCISAMTSGGDLRVRPQSQVASGEYFISGVYIASA